MSGAGGIDIKKIQASLRAFKENPKAVIAMVAVVMLLDVGLVLRWQVVALGRAFGEGKKLMSDIAATRDASKTSGVNKTRLEDLRREKDNFGKMVVGSQDLPAVLEAISKSAEISGVRILRIQPTSEAKASTASSVLPENLRKQKISISARSSFHQLGRFVALTEGATAFMDIKSIEIQGDEQEYSKQVVTIVLEVLMQKA